MVEQSPINTDFCLDNSKKSVQCLSAVSSSESLRLNTLQVDYHFSKEVVLAAMTGYELGQQLQLLTFSLLSVGGN